MIAFWLFPSFAVYKLCLLSLVAALSSRLRRLLHTYLPLGFLSSKMNSHFLANAISVILIILGFTTRTHAQEDAVQALQALLANAQISTTAAAIALTPTDLTAVRNKVLVGNFSGRPDSSRHLCPVSCTNAGINSSAWFVYNNPRRLQLCEKPMLLSFGISNQLDHEKSRAKIAACTADLEVDSSMELASSDIQVSKHGIRKLLV